jgi:hypothetical protein
MRKLRIAAWAVKEGNVTLSNGLIRVNPNKPTFGSLMLIEDVATISGGFITQRNKTGFIVGQVAQLEAIIKAKGLKAGDDFNEKMGEAYKIVTIEMVESATPEGRGFKAKINPTTNEALTKDGEAIFWRRQVVPESSAEVDVLIDHDGKGESNQGTPRDSHQYAGLNQEEIAEFSGAAKLQQRGK